MKKCGTMTKIEVLNYGISTVFVGMLTRTTKLTME
jgi:hypothetical protein